MTDSVNRVPMAKDLVWARVLRPNVPLVYLDMNHFINLARANTGQQAAPGYVELLKAARTAAREGRATFPLSEAHIWEQHGIEDPRQRNNNADVMQVLSGFTYILGRPEIARLEIEAGMDAIDGAPPSSELTTCLIGPGFSWAFGFINQVNIRDAFGNDGSAAARLTMGDDEFNKLMRRAQYMLQRGILAGPSDEERDDLRANYGYDPESAREANKSRLAYEVDWAPILEDNPEWRPGRLRDAVSAREYTHEWLPAMNEISRRRFDDGKGQFDPNEDAYRAFLAAMPHTQVAISMKTRYHRNPNHVWTENDIIDIDAMSVAYAYCDAVFTDKAARAALVDQKELRGIETFTPRRPHDLSDWLNALPAPTISGLLLPHPRPPGSFVR